jgi:hypothetical protein
MNAITLALKIGPSETKPGLRLGRYPHGSFARFDLEASASSRLNVGMPGSGESAILRRTRRRAVQKRYVVRLTDLEWCELDALTRN